MGNEQTRSASVRDRDNRLIDEAETNAIDRRKVLERDLGEDFDPLLLEEDDAAHVAVLLVMDRNKELRRALDKASQEVASEYKVAERQSQAIFDLIDTAKLTRDTLRTMAVGRPDEYPWREIRAIAEKLDRSIGGAPRGGFTDRVWDAIGREGQS